MEKTYITKTEKLTNRAVFMRRIYKLAVWLANRYGIENEMCECTYYFHDKNNTKLLTVVLTFN